jgi:hypothetical protein
LKYILDVKYCSEEMGSLFVRRMLAIWTNENPYYSLRAYRRRPQRYMAHDSASAINARDPHHPPHRPPWRLRHPRIHPPWPPPSSPPPALPPRHPRIHCAPALAPPASTRASAPLSPKSRIPSGNGVRRSQVAEDPPHPPTHSVDGARRSRWPRIRPTLLPTF